MEDLNDETSNEVVIERNFLSRKQNIRKINGVPVLEKDFESVLKIQLKKFNKHFLAISFELYGENML
ncbi:hypothetical protein [Paenibacillus sp. N3.4]|uniref:hypothetical protein n=1 Tax=Paenibacillus sp. N3.4 TaxID=2603222 RepID=UPI001C9CE200|nr:hypothetical protein [Paenibacillus sp. N3.4]